MRSRVAVIFVLLLPAVAVAVASDEPVTESDALRLFLEESPQAQKVPLIVQSIGAELRVDARVSNPDVAYQVEDAAGVRDEFLTIQQELPITGRLGLLRESADAASSAAGLAAERDLEAAAYALRASFYEVVYRDSVFERLQRGAGLLDRVVDILAQREREGEGSGYDLLRAEQELAEIGIATAEAEAALSVARSRFGSFFDPALRMEAAALEGDLQSTDAIPEPDEAIERALSQRADLRALLVEAERRDLERRAARRRRFPEPTVTAGWKRTEGLGLEDTGFIASLTVPLPIFDRGQVTLARASADRQRAELETEIRKREIRAEVLASLARERAARQAAQRHGKDIEQRAGELRRIAQLAYDEGENGILELLDAHRTSLGMELRALAVQYEAKSAEIDRNRAIGVEVRP
jgi:cobalt-zinc-cadmium efflux system outer membrane protein